MVGAQRSNRCETCRRRKIKCDEAWPVCGQCKAKNRMCPARPALKVLDDGLKILRRHGATANLPGDSYAGSNVSLLDTAQPASLPGYKSHNSRHSRMHDSMPLSPSEQLCLTFIDSLQVTNFSYSLRVLGEFVWEVPRYLGNSKALDGAITCVLASQKQLLLNGDDGLTINAQLYNRALLSLRAALAGPRSCCSSDTLAATVMMHRIEALFGTLPNSNIKVHAAGLAALHQKRGPPDPDDKLAFQATVDSHLSIIQFALSQRKDCFLASDAWAAVLDRPNGRTNVQMVYYRLVRLMTIWPTLARENFQIRAGDSAVNPLIPLRRARDVLNKLSRIDHDMGGIIFRQSKITTKPSATTDGLVQMMFEVEDPLAAMLLCHLATFSIIVHRIALSIMQNTTCENEELGGFEGRILYQSRRIWMLLDYSRSNKPLGLPIMTAALLFTYEPAKDPATRRAIVAALNDLDCGRLGSMPWCAERIGRATAALLGE
ncbi:hypothetical protein ACSS6W_005203 [Trichoderma asperelloides]|nr:hypothetical protein LI328DRAFT_168016 [Trichoderma asperelloides]